MPSTAPAPAAEDQLISTVVAATLEKQRKKHLPDQLARRAFHSKSHGTVAARFTVRADLPPELRVGLFARPATYEAVARFSNGARPATARDSQANIRGLALKLKGVPGPKALAGEESSAEHDFVLANHPVFFAPTLEHMAFFVTRRFGRLLTTHLRLPLLLIASMFKRVGHLLELSYYSQVPYAWGDRACKYALVPATPPAPSSIPDPDAPDFLRHRLEQSLRAGEVQFHFCVQLQQDPARESLEDSSVAWSGPYVPVADVTFARLDRPLQESDGEALSFNPWRALPAHRPLGWPGRLRQTAYSAHFQWRAEHNRAQPASAGA